MYQALKNIFNPAALAETFKKLEPAKSTVMDNMFKGRVTHPSPLLSYAEIQNTVQTVPLVRRDGSPVPLGNDDLSLHSFAPLPIKPSVSVTASELNDLKILMGNDAAIASWRDRKIEQLRNAVHATTEAMASVVFTTGKISWPVDLKSGRTMTHEIDFGTIPVYGETTKLTADSTLSEVYNVLSGMAKQIARSGFGNNADFYAGADVFSLLIDIADKPYSRSNENIKVQLDRHTINIGGYAVTALNEEYPTPDGNWVNKMGAKMLQATSQNHAGAIYYCALDSISANNQAIPFHVVPVKSDDDSSIELIAQSKPVPLRSSQASCKWQAIA